jgi:hypothetical protein
MPNTPKGYSTLSDHLHFHLNENQLPPNRDRVKDRDRRRQVERKRMFGNLKRGFRLLLNLTQM